MRTPTSEDKLNSFVTSGASRSAVRQDADDVLVFVRAKPRANRSRVLGEKDGELLVSLCAPPVDGAANEELILVVAKRLGVAKSHVTLERGEASRHKVLRVSRASADDVRRTLSAFD